MSCVTLSVSLSQSLAVWIRALTLPPAGRVTLDR